MLQMVADYQQSGQRQLSFCQSPGLKLAQLDYWVRKIRKVREAVAGFIQIDTHYPAETANQLELVYLGGIILVCSRQTQQLIGQLLRLQPMLSLSSSHSFYLYSAAVIMRKSSDELYRLICSQADKEPAFRAVFVFLNRSLYLLKLLHLKLGGFRQCPDTYGPELRQALGRWQSGGLYLLYLPTRPFRNWHKGSGKSVRQGGANPQDYQ